MCRSCRSFSCLIVLGLASTGVLAQPGFDLSVTAPDIVRGGPESEQVFEATSWLTTSGEGQTEDSDGAQGWSIGLSTTGACVIDVATTEGTAGDLVPVGFRRPASFEATELTSGEGNEGVVATSMLLSGAGFGSP